MAGHPARLAGIGNDPAGGALELLPSGFGAVALEDARLLLHDLAERPEGDAVAVWKRSSLPPDGVLAERVSSSSRILLFPIPGTPTT